MCTPYYQPNAFLQRKEPSLTPLPSFIPYNQIDRYGTQTETGFYDGNDARLFNPIRNQGMVLDRMPYMVPEPSAEQLYSPDNNPIGRPYGNYSQVPLGDISYYNDKNIAQTLREPVFSTSAQVLGFNWYDPMGNYKPQYYRMPVSNEGRSAKTRGLTSIRDENEFRENLMASQQARRNQQSYIQRWGLQ